MLLLLHLRIVVLRIGMKKHRLRVSDVYLVSSFFAERTQIRFSADASS